MEITVQGIFGSPAEARPIMTTIRQQLSGVKRVYLIVKGEQVEDPEIPRKTTGRGMSFAVIGAVLGMLMGAIMANVLPLGDNRLILDTVYGALTGLVAGALIGYVLSGIFMAAILSNDSKNMTNALQHGDVVLRAEVEPEEAAQVAQMLIAGGARRSDGTPGVERSDELPTERTVI